MIPTQLYNTDKLVYHMYDKHNDKVVEINW